MQMNSVFMHVRASAGRLLSAAIGPLVLLALMAPAAGGQRAVTRDVIMSESPDQPDHRLQRDGFRLFGNADLAGTGMGMTGEFGWGLSNLGPCSDGFELFQCGDIFARGAFRFQVFEISITAGTPPSEFRKIRNAHPDIQANSTGGGFTQLLNYKLFSGRAEVGPADGTLGVLFSGASSTDDATCRNNEGPLNGYMTTGVSLLAGSDCPDTWAGGVFNGPRPIPDSAYIRAFLAEPDSFNFDWFRIAESEKDQTGFLGDFSTYGGLSDHYDEILATYGGVTRLGTGPSSIQGYPLGLDMHFEAFQFGLPTIRNAVFWQMTVVNNSADLYGTGIDYDSLYMGLELGWGSFQANAIYYVPEQSAVKVSTTGVSGTLNCNGATAPPGVSPCATIGFTNGAIGIINLKSPIGDIRNKLLTDPASSFYNPSNVHAGDTITFNHGHICGFGSCWSTTMNTNDRRGFGMISSTAANVLDGQTPGSMTAFQHWRTFRNVDFPAQTGRFNYYVPGNWDYNKDGSADTLFYDTCHVQGCVATWSDTMPGKQVNRYGNVGGVMTAGPFSLGAGDTTSFIWAFIGAPDSSSFETLVESATDAYLGFYLTPKPPPVPEIASVEIEATAVSDNASPFVRLTWTDDPEDFTDRFLDQFAATFAVSPTFARLRALNPGLLDSITARAEQNFYALYIFKSCDEGTTFTRDSDCIGDEAVDQAGNSIGAGWQPYATFLADEDGQVPNELTDFNVIGGRTYLYSLVTQSRGFSLPIIDSVDTDGDLEFDAIAASTFTVSDSIISSLQRSGPTTARVYVPVSLAAGSLPAAVNFTTIAGFATVPVNARFTQEVVGGTYLLKFGNRFVIITETDSASGVVQRTRVVVQDVVDAQRGSDTTLLAGFPVQQDTLTTTEPVQLAGSSAVLSDTTIGSTRIVTEEVVGLGFVLVSPDGEPLFVSTDLTPNGTTPSGFATRSDFPGFTLRLDQREAQDLVFERILQTDGDTILVNLMNNNAVQLQEGSTSLLGSASGRYEVTFGQDAFGPGVPFTLDFSDVQGTRDAVDASLRARQTVTTGATGQGINDVLATANPSLGSATLIPLQFPFAIENTTFGREAILAFVESDKQSSILFGSGTDTLRIPVPDSVWVPGDRFYVLEIVQRDSTAGGNVVLGANDQPIQVTDTIVSLGPIQLGCNTPRTSCNPLAPTARGSTGYLPYGPGWMLVFDYATPFDVSSEVELDVTALQISANMTATDFENIRVVPNPFVFQSQFDVVGGQRVGEPRILFTGVPVRGTMRIFSVSGQFLQRLQWTEADLEGTGDLPYNLRTREGTELASGLYIYVITAENGSGATQYARGKFVVIR